MIGIVSICCVPQRAENSEQSEMVSQLLFGERVEILEVQKKWLRVRNCLDKYEGWVDKKMIHILGKDEEQLFSESDFKCTQKAISFCRIKDTDHSIAIAGGSFIPFKDGELLAIANIQLELTEHDSLISPPQHKLIVERAKEYINAPYLWGGKTVMGIDCSGLTQVVYASCGISLPRDASQQVNLGKTVDFLSETAPGDLAFFENEAGKIIHVGILISPQKIIHASGWVKIENIDSQGILSSQSGKHSHKLRIIKRIQ